MFTICQDDHGQDWPIPNGDFQTREEAESAVRELEENLGWEGMYIIETEDEGKED